MASINIFRLISNRRDLDNLIDDTLYPAIVGLPLELNIQLSGFD